MLEIICNLYSRYRADHESGYVADVTYEGEAIPYIAPAKPAYPAVRL